MPSSGAIRIVAALDGDRTHRHHDVGGQHGENAPRRLDWRNAEQLGDERSDGILCLGARNRHLAIEQHGRIQMSQRHQGIGQRRLAAAALVTGRPRKCAGALRTDFENPAHRDRRNTATARADGLDVHRMGSHRMARHGEFRLEQGKTGYHGHVRTGAANIERDQLVDPFHIAEMTAADDACDRS